MSIYLILDNQIHDVEAYERYKTAVKPMVEAAGGEYLTRDGKIDSQMRISGDLELPTSGECKQIRSHSPCECVAWALCTCISDALRTTWR